MKSSKQITLATSIASLLIGVNVSLAEDVAAEGVNQYTAITPAQRVSSGWVEGDQDPGNLLNQIEARRTPRTGLVPFSPIQPLRNGVTSVTDKIYEAMYLRLGFSFHTVGQYTTNNLPNTLRHGGATDFDFVGTWELFNRGQPTQGEIFFGVEGRWDYGPIGPQNLGFVSLGTSGGTANSFSAYFPAFILRNLYYRMGSPEAGWAFRFGKITTDAMLLTNRHLTPNTTFLSNAGTGMFVAGYPDSALGMAGALYFADQRAYVAGLVADSNGNRFDFGRLYQGDFYKAAEVGLKIFPRTDRASYSKFLVWHTDGTFDGSPINANTGRQGWGYGAVLSQELTADGNTVVVARYGQAFNNASIYDQQAALALLRYQPFGSYSFDDDVLGVQINWIDSSTTGARNETSLETFYRFPLFPDLDTTLSYQAVFNPANTTNFDTAHVFSVRAVTSF
ncbi:carbohydrate porin [Labrenzia sp. PHM005]|uniref:carbohydrate porin n=1 Tax=Labrenzia sp. PHM005 TaxID=2590016 RepID=UPI00143DCAC0|nr:carbohydrate porin [Labrenzia sp. PHM005]